MSDPKFIAKYGMFEANASFLDGSRFWVSAKIDHISIALTGKNSHQPQTVTIDGVSAEHFAKTILTAIEARRRWLAENPPPGGEKEGR